MISTLHILLMVTSALAQAPVSPDGFTYVCANDAATQGLQAFATICPLRTTDNSLELTGKSESISYANAPTSYEISPDRFVIRVDCNYGSVPSAPYQLDCNYGAGGGGDAFQLLSGPDQCPATTINSGMQPATISGGNFRKRQTASIVQMRQPSYVCPRRTTQGIIYLTSTAYVFYPYSAFLPNHRVNCNYASPFGIFGCSYDADTGTLNPALSSPERCPTTACPSAPYQAQMRKRAIDRRQVKAADLRARRTAPAAAEAGTPRRKAVKKRPVEVK